MKSRRLLIMVSIVLAMLVASMDATITNTTMPVIAEELGGYSLYAWSFAAYMIFSTVLTPVAGRISDLYGRKKIFAFGISFFLLGSVLCGLADTMLQLVLYRAVQGMGAGFMLPFPLIIAGDLFSVEKRGKIQAIFSAMWGLSAVLAPLLGSLFIEVASWRWIFLINIPVCIVALICLLGYKEEYEPRKASVDVWGSVLFAGGVSLVLAATTVERLPWMYASLGAGLLWLFWMVEKRHPSPIVPLPLLKLPKIKWMIINSFLACAALYGTSSYVPLFLQHLNYSVFVSGLSLLGISVGWMASSVPAGKWVLRYGYARLLLASNLTLLASGIMLLFLGPSTGFIYVTLALTVQGAGFGLLFTVTTIGAQQLVQASQSGISTSLQMFSRNTGTAIGVTIMGSLLLQSEFMLGIRSIFIYGTLASCLALATIWFLRDRSDTLSTSQATVK
ncbi:MFS transporter [Paenibacillus sp. GCM10012307]|uniref:MFS-type drug efflux transporter P55 n=1 Tax=Paenibacillus roseus TaxID=2798579 RepID=A0A934MSB5_9BACL|nr:MFS transporter [Paenibacillus roseus]MBJ6363758.1 MFS transporter [Paenibacillus roseus]